MYENGLELVTVALRVPPAQALEPRIRRSTYVNNIPAKMAQTARAQAKA